MGKLLYILLISALVANSVCAQDTLLKVGQTAPEIRLPDSRGDTVSLASLKTGLVLIDFWASWCAPCVEEQPQLKALYKKFDAAVKEGKFEIVGVSLDKEKKNWQQLVARLKINWIQISDLRFWKSPVAKDYGIEELPFNVLIDGQKKILAINIHGKELEDFIQHYLAAGIASK
ncbi:TlpA family protein disulfide reductase [Niabella soli]|uniref:Thioredoxin n=1 Tax=Niabella soli DSM 19437 TaxID=929713 RepID=W0EZ36_9BACT|nr:TlpA disulfide reductase family protein [Niabella soli]AHF14346.1 thioredoxin [Niabella soli DSM 19437]